MTSRCSLVCTQLGLSIPIKEMDHVTLPPPPAHPPASVPQAIPPHHEQQKIWRLYVIASYFMWEKIKTGVTILSCTAGSPGETEENLPTRGLSEQSDESRVLRRELF